MYYWLFKYFYLIYNCIISQHTSDMRTPLRGERSWWRATASQRFYNNIVEILLYNNIEGVFHFHDLYDQGVYISMISMIRLRLDTTSITTLWWWQRWYATNQEPRSIEYWRVINTRGWSHCRWYTQVLMYGSTTESCWVNNHRSYSMDRS